MTFPGDAGTVTVGVCPQAGSLVPTNTPLAKFLTLGANASRDRRHDRRAGRPRRLRRHLLERGDHCERREPARRARRPRVGAPRVHRNDRRRRRHARRRRAASPARCRRWASTPRTHPRSRCKPANGVGSCAAGVATIGPGTYTRRATDRPRSARARRCGCSPASSISTSATRCGTRRASRSSAAPRRGPAARRRRSPADAIPPRRERSWSSAARARSRCRPVRRSTCAASTPSKARRRSSSRSLGLTAALGGMATESGCVTTINSCAVLQAHRRRNRRPHRGNGRRPPGQARLPTRRRSLRDHRRARRPRDQRRARGGEPRGGDRHDERAAFRRQRGADRDDRRRQLARDARRAPAGPNPTPTISDWVIQH